MWYYNYLHRGKKKIMAIIKTVTTFGGFELSVLKVPWLGYLSLFFVR